MSRCFIVLGMHRSATSLIAKGLHLAGVNMGTNMLPPDSGNPHGYWEDLDFLNLNKMILRLAGGNWYNVPDEQKILEVGERADVRGQIKELIEKRYAENDLWGFKDPRTTLTIKVIQPFLKEHFFYVAFRNPVEVAHSLLKRNLGDMAAHVQVAKEYNRRLFEFLMTHSWGLWK